MTQQDNLVRSRDAGISNPTVRVLDILNFLAAHPTESFTLAQICRHVGLTKASGHRILVTMTEAKFLARNAQHKTYSLGVAPIAVGVAALEKHRGIHIARKHMALLTASLDARCNLSTIVDGEMLLLATEGMPQSFSAVHHVGERSLAIPPIGIGMIAWQDSDAFEAYLARAASAFGADQVAFLRNAILVIRERGFAMVANGAGMKRLMQAMFRPPGGAPDSAYWAALHKAVGNLSQDEMQVLDRGDQSLPPLAYISSAIFDAAGAPIYELILTGLPSTLSTTNVAIYTERLQAACSVITAEMRGKPPR